MYNLILFQLLTQRQTLMKRAYRYPIDVLEEFTTGMAHKVFVCPSHAHFLTGVIV